MDKGCALIRMGCHCYRKNKQPNKTPGDSGSVSVALASNTDTLLSSLSHQKTHPKDEACRCKFEENVLLLWDGVSDATLHTRLIHEYFNAAIT